MVRRTAKKKIQRRKARGQRKPVPPKAVCVVKRGGKNVCHAYDERKVYGSVYAACSVVGEPEQACEKVADAVARSVSASVRRRREISSDKIAQHVARELRKHNRHAAFMYETHRDIG